MTQKIIPTIKALAYIVIITLAIIIPVFIANFFIGLLSFKDGELYKAPNKISSLARKLSDMVDDLIN